MAVKILLASREGLSALTEVNHSAYSLELLARFADERWADINYMFNFLKGRLAARYNHAGTGKVVGFACWTHEIASDEVDPTPMATIVSKMPPTVNVEFMKTVGPEFEQLREHMKGEERYYLSSFAVELSQQNKGIGSQLLNHCLQIVDDAALPTWLISFPRSHDLYVRFRFCDNRMRVYGVYRQYAMVRRLK
ncbi:acyl-CoA N-acyltransferase [Xylaria arbuscula]|nr:acyl-CoA N-acyltransferase [Xylaria arbuscula]